MAVEYTFHAVNEPYGWAREFSTDRRFALYVFSIFAVIYACLAAVQLHANACLADIAGADDANRKAAHPFARMLFFGIFCGLAASATSVVHTALYASNGHGSFGAYIIAKLLTVSSTFVLISMLLLVSEGKCISYVMVMGDARRMCRLLGIFLMACFALELWGDYSDSRNYTTDYVYATPFGWAIVVVDLLLLGLYGSNLRATLASEHDKDNRTFYRTWGCVYGSWFLALPVTALLSQAVLAPYVWYIVSLILTNSATVVAYTALVVGLWPRNQRTYFKLGQTTLDDMMEACPSPFSHRQTVAVAGPVLLGSVPASLKLKGKPAKIGFGALS